MCKKCIERCAEALWESERARREQSMGMLLNAEPQWKDLTTKQKQRIRNSVLIVLRTGRLSECPEAVKEAIRIYCQPVGAPEERVLDMLRTAEDTVE